MLTPERREAALAYLARRPYENVYVAWLITTGQATRGDVLVWHDDRGFLSGVCYLGMQIVPCADGDDAIDAFAARAQRTRDARMIVGPRRNVERFWDHARTWMPAPTALRASQPLYARNAALGVRANFDGDVARATRADLEDIVPASAAMIAGEVGGDPGRASFEFRARTGRIIDAGWWWRYRVDGRLAFMCNVGAATAQTAQIQGVWTPPEMRRAGYATQGFTAICTQLLAEFPSLCLYVNDFNDRAIALYERVGFERVGEFQTILFA